MDTPPEDTSMDKDERKPYVKPEVVTHTEEEVLDNLKVSLQSPVAGNITLTGSVTTT